MQSDEELVAMLVEGDDAALEKLLSRYQRGLSAFIWRNTGGREVEDLYQETWLRVVRNAAKFDQSRRFSTWLFQIAINLCRDWHRRKSPEPVGADIQPPDHEDQPNLHARVDARTLISYLEPGQREVIILRFYHDMSEELIANILDIPKGTVKSRLHGALKKMALAAQGEPI